MFIFLKTIKFFLILIILLIIIFLLLTLFFYLTNKDRPGGEWELGQQKLQKIDFEEGKVLISDLRNYDWTRIGSEEGYMDFGFELNDIEGIEVGVSHFAAQDFIAHVFIVFNLKDKEDIALSIESRRRDVQDFTLIEALKFDYDLAYFITTKNDLISLRDKRKEEIHLYPTIASPEKSQELFSLISEKVNGLYEKPERYHLFFKNCTNLIANEIENISDERFPFFQKTFAPGYAGKVIFDMGLIDTELEEFDEVQDRYLIKFD